MTAIYEIHARAGRTEWWRYALTVVVSPVVAICLGIPLVVILALLKLLPANFAAIALDASHPATFFAINGAAFGFVLAGFAIGARLAHGKRVRDICGAFSPRQLGFGFIAWTLVLLVAGLIDYAIDPTGFRLSFGPKTPELALWATIGLTVQTFAEEFIFRGYLTQGLLLAIKRPLPTAIVSGLLFGALHIPNGAPQAASATLFGVGMALVAIRTGGIAMTFGLHLANNLFGAVILTSSGDAFRGSPGLVTQHTPQLDWWDTAVGGVAILIFAAAIWLRAGSASDEPAVEGSAASS